MSDKIHDDGLTSNSDSSRITGFHTDEFGDWVAEFSCGHNQHMRHNPPWQLREWVTTEAGRNEKLGMVVECSQCHNAIEQSGA